MDLSNFDNLDSKEVFRWFSEISNIPRESGHEKEISDFLVKFAKDRKLEVYQDKENNVIIKKKAADGFENVKPVIIQGHMDMVCEKTKESKHDFRKDPIELILEGDILRANNTTLGADDGIAVAFAMALLDSNDIPHPALEVLITTAEETSMHGAFYVTSEHLQGKTLINIDAEEEGVFFVSCAGGINTIIDFDIVRESNSNDALKIEVSSAVNNYNIEEIIESFNSLRNYKDVYLFGAVSVGKSSLVNAFLKVFKNKTSQMITTSPYPQTTLNVIKVPLGDDSYIYDTPGVMIETSIFNHIDRKLLKYVLPRKTIKPKVYQLRDNQSLIVNNLAKIDFKNGGNIILFMSNDLEVRRSKMEKSDQIFNNLIKNKHFKLLDRNVKEVSDLQSHSITLPNEYCDVVISGLLWFKMKGNNQNIVVHTLKGVDVAIRECKI